MYFESEVMASGVDVGLKVSKKGIEVLCSQWAAMPAPLSLFTWVQALAELVQKRSISHSIQDFTFLLPGFLLLENMLKTNVCLTKQFCGLSGIMYLRVLQIQSSVFLNE